MTLRWNTLPAEQRKLVERSGPPGWIAPMLATLTDTRFSDPDWIYERKLDGERALAFCKGGTVRLLSRNRNDIGSTYPELVDALSEQTCDDFVLDGEIVAFTGDTTSFSRLQQRMQRSEPEQATGRSVAVYYYLFDMPYLSGFTLQRLPLRSRKTLLRDAVRFRDPLRYMVHRNREGEAYLEQACAKGWEGVIAKRAGSDYQRSRTTDWLKFKCAKGQELVIGGFTEPESTRIGFGALLVGYYEKGRLHYAGKVGTGYDDAFLAEFRKRLERLSRKDSPFSEGISEKRAHWVTPKLVGEFGFTEWTEGGKLRHPRFLGLRRDKAAKQVVREKPDG